MRRFVIGGIFVELAILVIGLTWISPMAHRAHAAPGTTVVRTTVPSSTYTPATKTFVITTVPMLVHEQTKTFGYLNKDFKSGVLKGKEVWAFNPSSLTVYQGDTVDIQLVNPSGDAHTFTLADLGFNLDVKAQGTASGSFVASKVGVFTFACEMPEHMPFMWGQLVVLPDGSAPQS